MDTSSHELLNRRAVIVYAIHTAEARRIAIDIASAQNDEASFALAQQSDQDAYCTAGFAWYAKRNASDDVSQIEFCVKHAERIKDETIARTAQVLEGAMDVDPAMLAAYTESYQGLLNRDALFKDMHMLNVQLLGIFDQEGVSASVRDAFDVSNAQAVETEWNKFREWFPNAFLLSKLIVETNPEFGVDHDDNPLSPEDTASSIALILIAAREAQGSG